MNDNQIRYSFFPIPDDLTKFVKHIWCFESLPNSGDYFIFRTYANINSSLIFAYSGKLSYASAEINSSSFLLGQTKTWKRYRTSGDFGIFGVTLHPFVIPGLFTIPAYLATDKIVDLNKIVQRDTTGVLNEIAESKSNEYRAEAVCKLLRLQKFQWDPAHKLFADLSHNVNFKKAYNIDELLSQINMSRRTFERKFSHLSGYSPKSFINVLRFQTAFNRSVFDKSALIDTVYDLEFYDQAHFANSFKNYSGFNPSQFSKPVIQDQNVWENFVAFFQFISVCPPVLCRSK